MISIVLFNIYCKELIIITMNLKNKEKNYDEENKDYYDIGINIESLVGIKDGYEIESTETGMEQYKNKSNNKCCVVGVVGNRNKRKSYLLSKLSGIEIPIGHTITTKGLSVNFPKEKNSKSGIVLIDTTGLETPLLKTETSQENIEVTNLIARDKQLTELVLERFMICKSNILLDVVEALNL